MSRIITPLLLGLPVLALLLWLGFWQLDRADQKRALAVGYAAGVEAQPHRIVDAEDLLALPRHTPVIASGRYVSDRQILLDAQVHEGRVGYRVWTPFELASGDWIAVDRGWVAAGSDRDRLPDVSVGGDAREVAGLRVPLPEPGLRLGDAVAPDATWPRRLVWPDLEDIAQAWDRDVPGVLVLLTPEAPDGYVRAWAPAGMPAERHIGYAVQWFSLAAALVVIALVLGFRNRRHE
ncbi:MAG: SURF1 family protein [Gammaproteobacteria bacterium]